MRHRQRLHRLRAELVKLAQRHNAGRCLSVCKDDGAVVWVGWPDDQGGGVDYRRGLNGQADGDATIYTDADLRAFEEAGGTVIHVIWEDIAHADDADSDQIID